MSLALVRWKGCYTRITSVIASAQHKHIRNSTQGCNTHTTTRSLHSATMGIQDRSVSMLSRSVSPMYLTGQIRAVKHRGRPQDKAREAGGEKKDTGESCSSSSSSAGGASTSSSASSSPGDPDFAYLSDEESTRASLLAFAQFEAQQRAKAKSQQIMTNTSNQPDGAATTTSTVAHSTTDNERDSSARQDDASVSTSMAAFAALEKQLAKKKLDAKRAYLQEQASASSHARPSGAPTTAPTQLVPPREPEPWECCGMSCPNCVWIVYAEQLAEYEDQLAEQQRQQKS